MEEKRREEKRREEKRREEKRREEKRREAGFSLMEMMIVLLIVAIIAAASAPMINKKMLSEASNKSPWVWTDGASIAYNLKNANVSAVIGGIKAPNVGTTSAPKIPRLFVKTTDSPQITLGYNNEKMNIMAGQEGSLAITNSHGDPTGLSKNSIAIGSSANAEEDGVALGSGARSSGSSAIAIGKGAEVRSPNSLYPGGIGIGAISLGSSVVIGYGAECGAVSTPGGPASYAVAVGAKSKTHRDGVAVGYEATNNNYGSIAIGNNATTDGTYSIAIGDNDISEATTGAHAQGSKDIAIGNGANTDSAGDSIAIGNLATAKEGSVVAIGGLAEASKQFSVAIGSDSFARGKGAIAIGENAGASGEYSIAIGDEETRAKNLNSVAIGAGAVADKDNQIVLGNASSTVYIPGRLIVGTDFAAYNVFVKQNFIAFGNHRGAAYGEGGLTKSYYPFNVREASTGYSGSSYTVTGGGKLWDEYFPITSDRRLKDVGKAFVGGLEEIKKLEVFNYTFKKDPAKTPRVGVMAQDLQKIFPDAVIKGEDGFLRIRMEDMFYALVNAVKELAAKFDLVDKRIAELERQNQELKKQNEEIKAQNEVIKKENAEIQKSFKSLEKRLAKLEK